MAVRRAASRALTAGERAGVKKAVQGSKNRAARRRLAAEKAMRKGSSSRSSNSP